MTGTEVRDLTSRVQASVRVSGLDEGSAELTWGQRFVWEIVRSLEPVNHYLNLGFRVHLPTDVTSEQVLEALETLVRRHDTLRTRFPLGSDGEPRQWCDSSGELPVEICETEPGNVRRLAEQEEQRLWRQSFRNEDEWPLRTSLVVARGRPRQIVFVFSHLAVDGWGCVVFRREFLELLRGARTEPTLAGWQPRQRAAFEASAQGRKANDLALAYWRRMLESMPQSTFPTLREAGERPLFPGVGLHSTALAAAAQAVAARHRVGPAAVLLGVLSTLLGIRTGTEAVPLVLATGNRFTSVDVGSVGTFYQIAPMAVRLDPGSLAGTIRNAHRASTLASLRGQCDPRDVARLQETVRHQRGVDIDLSSTVNVVPEPGGAALPPTTFDVAELRRLSATTALSDLDGRDSEQLKLYVHVKSLRSRAVIEVFSDSRYLASADARRVLAGLELVLIELLEVGDLGLDRVSELVRLTPLAGPANRAVVDNCRIDLDEVRDLLNDLPATVAAEVFVEQVGDGPARLVGYVAVAEPTTPERLHAALLGRLHGNLTMTPQYYVICRSAPARTGSRAEWDRQPVLLQGTGRAGEQSSGPTAAPPVDTLPEA